MYLSSFSEDRLPTLSTVIEEEETTDKIVLYPDKIEYIARDQACQTYFNHVPRGCNRQRVFSYWSGIISVLAFFVLMVTILYQWLSITPFASEKSPVFEQDEPRNFSITTMRSTMGDTGAEIVYQTKQAIKISTFRDWVDCILGWDGEVCKRQ